MSILFIFKRDMPSPNYKATVVTRAEAKRRRLARHSRQLVEYTATVVTRAEANRDYKLRMWFILQWDLVTTICQYLTPRDIILFSSVNKDFLWRLFEFRCALGLLSQCNPLRVVAGDESRVLRRQLLYDHSYFMNERLIFNFKSGVLPVPYYADNGHDIFVLTDGLAYREISAKIDIYNGTLTLLASECLEIDGNFYWKCKRFLVNHHHTVGSLAHTVFSCLGRPSVSGAMIIQWLRTGQIYRMPCVRAVDYFTSQPNVIT